MIKCLKCNTLYSESAKVCVYCKIPLEANSNFDANYFSFKIKEFTTELEAQNFKANLLITEVPCAIRKEEDKYIVYIPEDAKKNAFKQNKSSILDEPYRGNDNRGGKNKVTYYIAILLIFIICCFLFYFSQARKIIFTESRKIDYKIVTEGGTVDPRIIDVKSKNTSQMKEKKESKTKVEDPSSH